MVTTFVTSLTGSTSLMIVTLTNVLVLVPGDALLTLDSSIDPLVAMFTMTFLFEVIMFLLGVLRLGSIIRFVSVEVMGALYLRRRCLLFKAIMMNWSATSRPWNKQASW